MSPGGIPTWTQCRFEVSHPRNYVRRWSKMGWLASIIRKFMLKDYSGITRLSLDWARSNETPYIIAGAITLEEVSERLDSDADITIATSFETALAVWRYGRGKKYYFCQHYEPLFANESKDPTWAGLHAKATYHLPDLNIIANSSWLACKLNQETSKNVPVCLNAINHDAFFPDVRSQRKEESFVILSYGGRNAEWKGINCAAQTISLVREHFNVEWRVFGSSLLKPENSIASYTPLGFITGEALRDAYANADVLLATSWYESFPLFPLEAMACGTSVVTTALGVEDYARNEENCLVVPAREPEASAAAIIRMLRDPALRERLARQALIDSKEYNWSASVKRLATILSLERV